MKLCAPLRGACPAGARAAVLEGECASAHTCLPTPGSLAFVDLVFVVWAVCEGPPRPTMGAASSACWVWG